MDKTLLKLLIEHTDENESLDLAGVKSSYQGNLNAGLRTLAREGYISILDMDDEIGEICLNKKAYQFFVK